MHQVTLGLSAVTVCIATGLAIWARRSYPYTPILLAAACHVASHALAIGNPARWGIAASWVFDVLFYALAWCVPFGALRTEDCDYTHWVFERNIGIYLAYLWTIVIAGMAAVSGALTGTASISRTHVLRMEDFCTYALWAYPALWLVQWFPLRRYKFHRGISLSLHVYFVCMVVVTISRSIYGPLSDDEAVYVVEFAIVEAFATLSLWWAIGVGIYWARNRRNRASVCALRSLENASEGYDDDETQSMTCFSARSKDMS